MVKQIFVNLPVKDLKKSMEFFTKLGFSFNQTFTNEQAASLVLGENIYAMLLTEDFFKTFTNKPIAQATKETEVINAISVETKEKVDELANLAASNGGKINKAPQDYGWMYSQSIEDVDGHIWELMYLDETKAPKNAE